MLNAVTRVYEGNEVLKIFGLAERRKTEMYMLSILSFGVVLVVLLLLFVYLAYSLNLLTTTFPEILLTVSMALILVAVVFVILILYATYLANRVDVQSAPDRLEELWNQDTKFVLDLTNELVKNRQISREEALTLLESIDAENEDEVEDATKDY